MSGTALMIRLGRVQHLGWRQQGRSQAAWRKLCLIFGAENLERPLRNVVRLQMPNGEFLFVDGIEWRVPNFVMGPVTPEPMKRLRPPSALFERYTL